MKRAAIRGGTLLCLLFSCAFAQLTREPNTTLAMPQNPAQRGYSFVQAFGRTFAAPVAMVTPPGETNRLFIVEQGGRILLITNVAANPTPPNLTFLDIRSRVLTGGEQGLLGLAFHPDYASNGYFYVFYTAPNPRRDRLSRFSVSSTDPNAADPGSEQIILDQVDEASNHNGGDLHFGPDGYLYVSLGDEGDGGDSLRNSQRIDKDFFSGILRIDVDKREGNLAPNPHAAVTANYLVPADNPFVGATNFNGIRLPDLTKVRTEFWATGLRNPWRMTFDPLTGVLWCADVGQGTREEIDIIVKGGNYGWNYREGTIAYTGTPPPGFVHINPIYDYPRSDGASVTGGRVYRGNKITQLYGAYIFGDYVSGNIWALRTNGTARAVVQRIAGLSGVAAFGYDPSNGDILAANVNGGQISRLVYSATTTGAALPPTLADTGAFSDLASLTVNPGIVPYELNVPFWSDGAVKKRWFSIPNLDGKMTFDPTNAWLTPTGSVWIKHFTIQTNTSDPNAVRRLETRFIVRNSNGVYGVTYRWTNETNAELVGETGLDEEIAIADGGNVRTQVWRYPSRSECLACHNSSAGHVLGFNTSQLNRDTRHGTLTQNQIASLGAAGYLNNPPSSPRAHLALAPANMTEVSQEWRVRSYLAANCAQCHRPGGVALGNFDARIGTSTDLAGIINGALVSSLGDPANRTLVPNDTEHSMMLKRISVRNIIRMPPIGSTVSDPAGVELLREFILGDLPTRQSFTQWQVAKFNEPLPPEAAASADPDADGASNLLEYFANSDPLQSGDAWGLRVAAANNGVSLAFTLPANRAVIFEAAATIDGPWTSMDSTPALHFPASPAAGFMLAPAEGDARYYRARLIAP